MKILVVDDESLARERLLRLLARVVPDAECREAVDGEAALAAVAADEPDLLLLDIRMPGLDGIAVATALEQRASPPAVVFCTAYDEYALEALRHQAVAYLLKPVREAELAAAIESAGRVNRVQLAALRAGEAEGMRSHLTSSTHRGVESLPVNEVRCLVADNKYVTAIAPEQQLLLPDTLKDLEQEFPDVFVRVHRNALVGIDFLRRLEKQPDGSWLAILDGITEKPAISRRHLTEVKLRLARR